MFIVSIFLHKNVLQKYHCQVTSQIKAHKKYQIFYFIFLGHMVYVIKNVALYKVTLNCKKVSGNNRPFIKSLTQFHLINKKHRRTVKVPSPSQVSYGSYEVVCQKIDWGFYSYYLLVYNVNIEVGFNLFVDNITFIHVSTIITKYCNSQ